MDFAARIDRLFRGRDLELFLRLPSLAVVEKKTDAEFLKRHYNPAQLVVAYMPDWLQRQADNADGSTNGRSKGETFKLRRRQIRGLFLPGKQLSDGMVDAYLRASDDAARHPTTENLAREAEAEAARQEEAESLLRHAADRLDPDHDPHWRRQLIQEIVETQFPMPECFIREAIQNSVAAAPDPAIHRIDVLLDEAGGLIRIEDNGRGMDREVLKNAFFTLFSSENEKNRRAAGRFGIGAVSFFGLGHESVTIDSLPESGNGVLAIVDRELNRGPLLPSKRQCPGTKIEIQLGEESKVSFRKVVEVLERDCCYVLTPVYVTQGGQSKRINREMLPESSGPKCLIFEEPLLQGFLRLTDHGEITFLSHRIRLQSIPMQGVEGVVNCDRLNTIFSRDAFRRDSISREVCRYLDRQMEILTGRDFNLFDASLGTRLRRYRRFVESKLTGLGGPDLVFLDKHVSELIHPRECNRELDDFIKNSFVAHCLRKLVHVLGRGSEAAVNWLFARIGKVDEDAKDKLSSKLSGVLFLAMFLSLPLFSMLGFPDSPWIYLLLGLPWLLIAGFTIRLGWIALGQHVRFWIAYPRIRRIFHRYRPVKLDIPVWRIIRNVGFGFAGLVLGASLLSEGLVQLADELAKIERFAERALVESPETKPGFWTVAVIGSVGLALLIFIVDSFAGSRPYRGDLSEEQQRLLGTVMQRLTRGADLNVAYGANLGPRDPPVVFRHRKLLINRTRDVQPWTVALLHAVQEGDHLSARQVLLKENNKERP